MTIPEPRLPERSFPAKSSTITTQNISGRLGSGDPREAHDNRNENRAEAGDRGISSRSNCTGLARVDFLMDPKSRKMFVNEINTMPGFTAISMYPKMWMASGSSYPDLIDRLIQLGIERHEDKKRNQYSR